MKRSASVLWALCSLAPLAAAPAAAQAAGHDGAEAEVAFTYGVRAYNHGDFEAAARLFREALAADPQSEAGRWLAAAERALELQRRGAAEPLAVPGLLGETVAPARGPRRFAGRLGAAFGHDGNPLQLADGVQARFAGRTLSAEDSDEVANFDGRLELYPFSGRGGWTLGLVAEGQQGAYSDLDFLDLRRLRGGAQLAWGSDPGGFLTGPLGYALVPVGSGRVALLLQAGVADTDLDGEAYLTTRQAAAALTLRGGRAAATQLEVELQDLDYDRSFVPVLERDGEQLTLKVSQILYLGGRDRYLRLTALGGERTAGAALEHRFLGAGAEAAWPVAPRLTLQAAVALRQEDYAHAASNPRGGARGDTVLRADGVLQWRLLGPLRLALRGSWTDRDSDYVPGFNDPPRDFDRVETALGLTWSF